MEAPFWVLELRVSGLGFPISRALQGLPELVRFRESRVCRSGHFGPFRVPSYGAEGHKSI